jgi:hypothetical protein
MENTSDVLDLLVTEHLTPEEFWHLRFIDRRERRIFTTANRHYLRVDEPDVPITEIRDAVLRRWESGDKDLLVVPRMTRAVRDALVHAFLDKTSDRAVRAALEARFARLHDNWRPYAFMQFADDQAPQHQEEWLRLIRGAAREAVTTWLRSVSVQLDGFTLLQLG